MTKQRYPGQISFLEAINSDATLKPEQRENLRQMCYADYRERLLAFARQQTHIEQAEETMRELTEGRSAETLEHWLDQLSAW